MLHDAPSNTPPDSLVKAARRHAEVADAAQWTPLAGGRTNRLWKTGAYVVKLYDPKGATPLFPNDPDAEVAALTALEPAGLAPRLCADLHGDFGRALIYHFVDGATGYKEAKGVAGLLARVHNIPVPAGIRRGDNGSEDLLKTSEAIISVISGNTEEHKSFSRLLDVLTVQDAIVPIRPHLVHSDPVATNLVNAPQGTMLIDWQCPCSGDPCEDLAVILSPSMRMNYGGAEAMTDQVLAAYPDRDLVARYQRLAPYLHLRLAAYAQWSVENGRSTNTKAAQAELAVAQASLRSAEA